MARIYATTDDLPEAYRDDPNAEDLIRRASNLVTNRIASAIFPTDAYGMPTGDDLEAARDAVVIQVSTWLSTGVNPVTGYKGKGRTVTSKGSNGSTVAYAADLAAEAYLNRLAEGVALTPSAEVPLGAQGLLTIGLRLPGAGAGRLYARDYQPVRLEPQPADDMGLDPSFAGFVNLSRAEGVVRLDFNVRPTGEGVHDSYVLPPDYLWPGANITHQESGVRVSVNASTGFVSLSGVVVGDYAEGMMLWEASRG